MMDPSLIQWITEFGLAGGVAAYLIYWLTNHLKSKLDRIELKLDLINERLNDIKEVLKEIKEEIRKNQ